MARIQFTLIKDPIGCVHMWAGVGNVNANKSLPTMDGREADTLIQLQTDIESLEDHLTEAEAAQLDEGWILITNSIPEDYLIHE